MNHRSWRGADIGRKCVPGIEKHEVVPVSRDEETSYCSSDLQLWATAIHV